MRALRDLSIRHKLLAMTLLAGVATLLLLAAALAVYGVRAYRQTFARQLTTQAEIVASNATSALVFRDERAAAETLAALRAEPQIVFAGIYTPDGRLYARYAPGGAGERLAPAAADLGGIQAPRYGRDRLELARPIGPPERPIGMVYLRADLRELRNRVASYVGITAVFLAVSIAATLLIAWVMQKSISEPILDLSGLARQVASGKDYSLRATPRNRDEVGVLVESFNEMLGQIQQRDGALQAVNKQLGQRTQELARKNEEVEAFVYIVSHDLRGPLVNLQGFSRELERSCGSLERVLAGAGLPEAAGAPVKEILGTEIPDSLRFILASTSKFERLINALLQLSRSGRQEYRHDTLDMAELTRSTLDSLQADIARSGAEVVVSPLPAAQGDLTAVGQVVSNLVVNAVRYLQPGRPGRIEIGGREDGGMIRYWVRDNGVGIPESARKRLFQVFQRFHPRLAEGEGMGLATVKRIVERHGGRVWAESEEGSGTTFFFTLPAGSIPQEATA